MYNVHYLDRSENHLRLFYLGTHYWLDLLSQWIFNYLLIEFFKLNLNIFIAFMLYKRSQHSTFLQHFDQKNIGKLMSASVCYIWKLSKKDLQFNHLVRYLLLSVQICYSNKKILSIIGILSCRYNSIYLCQCTWDWSTVLAKWYILLHDYCGEPKSISSNSFCS